MLLRHCFWGGRGLRHPTIQRPNEHCVADYSKWKSHVFSCRQDQRQTVGNIVTVHEPAEIMQRSVFVVASVVGNLRTHVDTCIHATIFSERDTYVHVRYMPSAVRQSVVCLSVTLVHPTQPVEVFGNFFSPYDSSGTLVF